MNTFKPKPNKPKNQISFDKLKLNVKKFDIGDTFYTFDKYKNHIIGIIEDDGEKIMIYKSWLKYKGYWGYYCKTMDSLLYEICMVYKLSQEDSKKLFELNEVDYKGWIC